MFNNEFQLIEKYFQTASERHPEVKLGIGDDAAIVTVPEGMELVLSMDTLVGGIHFPSDTHASHIGYKALAVNLSDMAAMGAEPRWVSLSLTLPKNDESWLQQFMSGFSELATHYHLALIGGDLTHGPLAITIQIHGWLPEGESLRRSGAKPHDLVCISGTLGDAGFVLDVLQNKRKFQTELNSKLLNRLHRPSPRIELGLALRGIANSAIDISDGLLSDLGHIVNASHVAANINIKQIPLSATLSGLDDAVDYALAAGDDYELCFTVSSEKSQRLQGLKKKYPITCIGQITSGKGIHCFNADGSEYIPPRKGYTHF